MPFADLAFLLLAAARSKKSRCGNGTLAPLCFIVSDASRSGPKSEMGRIWHYEIRGRESAVCAPCFFAPGCSQEQKGNMRKRHSRDPLFHSVRCVPKRSEKRNGTHLSFVSLMVSQRRFAVSQMSFPAYISYGESNFDNVENSVQKPSVIHDRD